MNWRDKVDPAIKPHLEKHVAESVKDREAYDLAPNPGNAQLWVAIANLSKEVFDLNLRLKYLEKAVSEAVPRKKKIVKKKVSKTKQ